MHGWAVPAVYVVLLVAAASSAMVADDDDDHLFHPDLLTRWLLLYSYCPI